MINVKFKRLDKEAILPQKATDGSAAYDLYVPKDTLVEQGRNIVPLDFAINIPNGYEAQIRPRSGFSAKGIKGGNTFRERFNADVLLGTIDADYRGNIGVIIKNDDERFEIFKGTRIAQMVFNKIEDVRFEEVNELGQTERGNGGFGHTGSK